MTTGWPSRLVSGDPRYPVESGMTEPCRCERCRARLHVACCVLDEVAAVLLRGLAILLLIIGAVWLAKWFIEQL